MLTSVGQQHHSGCILFPDDRNPDHWYYMPEQPRVALDAEGKPILSMVWYRREPGELSEAELLTRLGGGLLNMSIDLAVSDAQMDEIRTFIHTLHLTPSPVLLQLAQARNQPLQQDRDRLTFSPVPVDGGLAHIALAGEPEAGGEFISTLVGAGKASTAANHRTAISAKLTQEGAVLLWKMLEQDLTAIRVGFEFKYRYRVPGIRMVVQCDAERMYNALQEYKAELTEYASWSTTHTRNSSTYTYGMDEDRSAEEALRILADDSQSSSVEIETEIALPPERLLELERAGHEMLNSFMAATFLQFNPVAFDANPPPELETELASVHGKKYGGHTLDYYDLRDWDQEMSASLTHVFEADAVLTGELIVNDNLSNVFGEHDPADFMVKLDFGADFYKFLTVDIRCTADFAADKVDLVTATLRYADATPETFIFDSKSGPGRFAQLRFDMDGVDRGTTYQYEVVVRYAESQASYTYEGESDASVLVLDTDALGVLKVDVAPGLLSWNRVEQVRVDLKYVGPETHEHQVVLSQGADRGGWLAAIGADVDKPYTWQATFVTPDEERIVGKVQESHARQLLIDQPFTDLLTVQLVPAGQFKNDGGLLQQVHIALEYKDPANAIAQEGIITLAETGDFKRWEVPLANPELRRYRYQIKVFYVDGMVRETDWVETEDTLLTVGDPFRRVVSFSPVMLKRFERFLPDAGTLHLRYDGDEVIEKTFSLDDFSKSIQWYFRGASEAKKTYSWQLTLFELSEDGVPIEVAFPANEAERDVIFLLPPQD